VGWLLGSDLKWSLHWKKIAGGVFSKSFSLKGMGLGLPHFVRTCLAETSKESERSLTLEVPLTWLVERKGHAELSSIKDQRTSHTKRKYESLLKLNLKERLAVGEAYCNAEFLSCLRMPSTALHDCTQLVQC
jgi:hypothetical protein